MSNQITYDDKVDLNIATDVANINKVTAADMNEIKSVVNAIDTGTSTSITNILTALNNPTYETSTGTGLTLTNTRAGRLKSTLYGDTSQDADPTPSNPKEVKTVTGDNKVRINKIQLFDKSQSIVSGYTFGGTGDLTSASAFFYQSYYIPVTPNTTYNFSGSRIIGSDSLRVCEYTNDQTFIKRNYETYTVTTTADTHYVRVSNYSTLLDTLVMVKGNTLPITYENYIGNCFEINLGKNNFDIGTDLGGWFQSSSNGETINNSTVERTTATISNNKLIINSYDTTGWTWISKWLDLKQNTNYVISGKNTQGIKIVGANSKAGSTQGTALVSKSASDTYKYFNTGSYKYYFLSFFPSAQNNYFQDIQIEVGVSPTNYASYFEPIELCKIGDYQDYIYKRGADWYKHEVVKKIVLNGSETITTRSNTSATHSKFVMANILPTEIAGHLYLNSTHFTVGNANDGAVSVDCFCSNNTSGYKKYLYFSVENEIASTTTAFGTWLSNNNVTVRYAQATPQDILITEPSLINQLNALDYDGQSYYDVTNITTVGQELAPIVKIDALEKIV